MHFNVFDFDKASNKKISLFVVHKFIYIFLHFQNPSLQYKNVQFSSNLTYYQNFFNSLIGILLVFFSIRNIWFLEHPVYLRACIRQEIDPKFSCFSLSAGQLPLDHAFILQKVLVSLPLPTQDRKSFQDIFRSRRHPALTSPCIYSNASLASLTLNNAYIRSRFEHFLFARSNLSHD